MTNPTTQRQHASIEATSVYTGLAPPEVWAYVLDLRRRNTHTHLTTTVATNNTNDQRNADALVAAPTEVNESPFLHAQHEQRETMCNAPSEVNVVLGNTFQIGNVGHKALSPNGYGAEQTDTDTDMQTG